MIILLATNIQSFVIVNNVGRVEKTGASRCSGAHFLRHVQAPVLNSLKSSQQDEDGTITTGNTEEEERQKGISEKSDEPDYPLDIPSPFLLGSSMLLAIASTGEC